MCLPDKFIRWGSPQGSALLGGWEVWAGTGAEGATKAPQPPPGHLQPHQELAAEPITDFTRPSDPQHQGAERRVEGRTAQDAGVGEDLPPDPRLQLPLPWLPLHPTGICFLLRPPWTPASREFTGLRLADMARLRCERGGGPRGSWQSTQGGGVLCGLQGLYLRATLYGQGQGQPEVASAPSGVLGAAAGALSGPSAQGMGRVLDRPDKLEEPGAGTRAPRAVGVKVQK